ncbi:MAG: proline dehydrogenase [Bacteroidetes bacterium]|nr:proline dehydrogenase [Bacteroidota bacterium]
MPTPTPEIRFDETEIAFAHRSDSDLRNSLLLFRMMSWSLLVQLGTRITPWAVKNRFPILPLLRSTIFRQFVGGENLTETRQVSDALQTFGVQVILDYGVEGKEGEDNFEAAKNEFIRVLEHAATCTNIPFISIKITGLARFALLEKLHALQQLQSGAFLSCYQNAQQRLAPDEREEWNRVIARVEEIVAVGARKGIGVLIDAEETWIQDPIDALTLQLMDRYNRERVTVFNTYQMYRHDRLNFLIDNFKASVQGGYRLGAKLVRGAYMEKERSRARKMGYPSPIQADKRATDRDYDAGLAFCVEHLDQIFLLVATHNEQSSLYAANLLVELNHPIHHPHIHWSQLYGMSDNITFNLAKAGCSVSKYLPFGPITDVIPYLMRRAQENTSVKGQTGRELSLLLEEKARRTRLAR